MLFLINYHFFWNNGIACIRSRNLRLEDITAEPQRLFDFAAIFILIEQPLRSNFEISSYFRKHKLHNFIPWHARIKDEHFRNILIKISPRFPFYQPIKNYTVHRQKDNITFLLCEQFDKNEKKNMQRHMRIAQKKKHTSKTGEL